MYESYITIAVKKMHVCYFHDAICLHIEDTQQALQTTTGLLEVTVQLSPLQPTLKGKKNKKIKKWSL